MTTRKLLWRSLLPGLLAIGSLDSTTPHHPLGVISSALQQSAPRASSSSPCDFAPAAAAFLRCIPFDGHLYAVADVDLRSQEIVFTTSADGMTETFPVVVRNLSRAGINPFLVTNAGIYGTDNRPMGLLISFKRKLHDVNTMARPGNFSWDSGVFQILDDGTASIVAAGTWQNTPRIIAATQSGPRLVSAGQINQSFRPQSKSLFRRTAIGVDQSSRQLVHLVVSRDAVTLFDLAAFMLDKLHSLEALHLDGDLSAFYIPSAPDKYIFVDPGERIVTVLSVVEKRAK